MRYVKMFGLLAATAAALMAFAGIASATEVTSPHGTQYTGPIHATNEGEVSLHGSNGVTIECQQSTVEGEIDTQGAGITAQGDIEALTFENCTNGYVVHVIEKGSLTAHTDPNDETGIADGNAILTSSGAIVEATAKTIFGTIRCVYTTNNTNLGTLTGSTSTGETATFDISASIPRTGGSSLCGSTGTWTGNYIVNTPMELNID